MREIARGEDSLPGPALCSEPAPPEDFGLDRAVGGIDGWDRQLYRRLVATELSAEERLRVAAPELVLPRQREVLAVHWHPEWVPLELARRRVDRMFPGRETELMIPTQHNQLLTLGGYAGVEVDCFAGGFGRKVQLLLHFKAERVRGAEVLKAMLAHTFRYRTSQLSFFMDTILDREGEKRLAEAVDNTGANQELVAFLRFYTARLRKLLEEFEASTPPEMIKNKLLGEYLDAQRHRHPDLMVNRGLLLLKAVKTLVKRDFPLDYFFAAEEVIEEARGLGGGVVIPHPEQFWPILLADYDVDGYEVWNPQSREYTDFLIRALDNQNKRRASGRRELLIFMGDDTHLSVKLKDPLRQERGKLEREVGLQPAWDEMAIGKTLSLIGCSRAKVIDLYRERLG